MLPLLRSLIRSSSRLGRPAFTGGFVLPPSLRLAHDHPSPRVLGSGRVVLSHPSTLLRPDPQLSPTPPAFPGLLVIPEVFARRPGLGCQGERPCFRSVLLPDAPSPLRREEKRGTPVSPRYPWPSSTEHGVGSSSSLTPASVRALLTTLQCSLHATARQIARPPGLVRPRGFLRPPRTFTPELARGRSPAPRVGYHYTASLGEDCDRTCTGWSTAVTGCTFCRKVSKPYYRLKRRYIKNTICCR